MDDQDPSVDTINVLAPESRADQIQREITRRQLLIAAGTGAAALSLPEAAFAALRRVREARSLENSLVIGNYLNYAAPADYKAFTKLFGPKVVLSTYSASQEMVAKVRSGGSSYD